jgi:transcriptional regulator with XRE-family HTH domain
MPPTFGFDRVAFHERLTLLRQRQGLSSKEMADRVGLSYSHLSRVERGYCQPNFGIIERWSKALGVSVGELLGGEGRGLPLARLRAQFEAIARLKPKVRRGVEKTIDLILKHVDESDGPVY